MGLAKSKCECKPFKSKSELPIHLTSDVTCKMCKARIIDRAFATDILATREEYKIHRVQKK